MNVMCTIVKAFPLLILALGVPLAHADEVPPVATASALDAPVSDDLLDGERGKARITNTNDLAGHLYDNNAVDVVTGSNLVSDGSLENNAGLATVIQNSGNNVLIQNAVILNIQMQ